MYDLFERIPLENEEKLSEKRADDIKAAVLSRIKEENNMSKHLTIKTISIAAAVATTAAVSAMIASAENTPQSPLLRDNTAQTATAEKTFTEKAEDVTLEVSEKPSDEKNTDIKTAEVIDVLSGEHFFVYWNEEKGDWNYPDFMKDGYLCIPWNEIAFD